MVLLVTLWFVALPFGLAALWWQHHWGLGPFDVLAWLDAQWAVLGAEAVSVLASSCSSSVSPGVSGAGGRSPARLRRRSRAFFAFTQGYLVGAVAHPLHDSLSLSAIASA